MLDNITRVAYGSKRNRAGFVSEPPTTKRYPSSVSKFLLTFSFRES